MRLRDRAEWSTRAVVVVAAGGAFSTIALLPGVSWLVWAALLPFVLLGTYRTARTAERIVVARARRDLERAIDEGRAEDARAMLLDFRQAYAGARPTLTLLDVAEASILLVERRHVDAVRLLESVDRGALTGVQRAAVTNNLAWALVLLGEGERALGEARASLEEMESLEGRSAAFDDLRASQLGTLGAALVVAGKPEEAIAPLEQSIARGGTPKQQGQRAFHLGEALDALGRAEDAEREWERAERLAAGTELAERAAHRLRPRSAYRGPTSHAVDAGRPPAGGEQPPRGFAQERESSATRSSRRS